MLQVIQNFMFINLNSHYLHACYKSEDPIYADAVSAFLNTYVNAECLLAY